MFAFDDMDEKRAVKLKGGNWPPEKQKREK